MSEGVTGSRAVLSLGRLVGFIALRTILLILVVAFLLNQFPETMEARSYGILAVVVGICVIYIIFFLLQIRQIKNSKYPSLRAAEAVVSSGILFLAAFAVIYVLIDGTQQGSFSEKLTPFNAYYFAMTVLATVGFGDITPVSTAARTASMIQMSLDLVFIGVVVRVFTSTAKKGSAKKANS
jgi:voltage-gated potassium channel